MLLRSLFPLLILYLFQPTPSALAASLQEQIDAAAPGGVVEVEPGEHAGPLRIDKPLTLRGTQQAVIQGDRRNHVIHIQADDVVIEGLSIRGSGTDLSHDHAGIMVEGSGAIIRGNRIEDCLHGIYLKKAKGCQLLDNRIVGKKEKLVPVEDVVSGALRLTPDGEMCYVGLDVNQRGNGIHMWNSTGNILERNSISDTRDGIYFSFTDHTQVRDNYVTHVRYGLHYMYSDENTFEQNRFEGNAAGAAIMYSKGLFVRDNTFANNRGRRAYGMLLNAIDNTVFLDNTVRQNTVGIYIENSNGNYFSGNGLSSNYIGVRMSASSMDNRFTANRFSGNLHSAELDRSSTRNEWAVDGTGNYWSTATTLDFDGDGVGELAHSESDLLGPYRREAPVVGLLSQSPALRLIEFVQSKVPLPGVPAIKDPAPLANAHPVAHRD